MQTSTALPSPAPPAGSAAGGSVPVLLQALYDAHAALDTATAPGPDGRPGWVSAEELSAVQLAEAIRLQAALEARIAGMRLRTVAAADTAGVAATTAATDTGAWAATAAGRNRTRSWGGVWLARLLETKYHHARTALDTGMISEAHAEIIVRAGESVPDGVSPADLADCEERLVAKAATMAPPNLRKAARRLLEPLSRRLADEHQEKLLGEQERRAEALASLALWDNGDGTWTGRFLLPDLHAQLLRNAVELLSSPRRRPDTQPAATDPTVPTGRSFHERLGSAFCELLEHLPEHGHARTGITLVVHVEEDQLRGAAGAGTLDTGSEISIGQVRRLACTAGHLPLVLSGRSIPLDLGATRRLFTPGQALALSARYDHCAAEGCGRPFSWCELHHLVAWEHGGPTDLANAIPLCGHHHRRIHDPLYHHQRLPDGSIRFEHRWPSRRRERAPGGLAA